VPAHITLGPEPGLFDEKWGTQDPQCAYDPHTEQYYLSYTAWAGPISGWGQKAALTAASPADKSWTRLGQVFSHNNSWPTSPVGNESNIKCSALWSVPDPKPAGMPRYYLYSGDVTPHGARVSTSDSLRGPWSKRVLVRGGDVGAAGSWDAHMGCFTPPVALDASSGGNLLVFYNAYPPK
jgi:hypothetical protein